MILANTTVAKVTALKGSAEIHQGSEIKSAKLGSELFSKDKVITKANAKVQVVFQDETIITIGKNSQFSVDEYISDGNEPEVKLSLFKGAMRTITGKIGKANPQKFKVRTKTATIGIRGTNFIVIVTPGQNDRVACTLGAITVRGNGGTFDVPSGFMTQITQNGEVQEIEAFSSGELGGMLDGAFGGIESAEKAEVKDQATDEQSGEVEETDDSTESTTASTEETDARAKIADEETGEVQETDADAETTGTEDSDESISEILLEETLTLETTTLDEGTVVLEVVEDSVQNLALTTTTETVVEEVSTIIADTVVDVPVVPEVPVYASGVSGATYTQYNNTWGGDPIPIAFLLKPYTLSYGINPVSQTFTADSSLTDFASGQQLFLSEQPVSFVSINEFETTFASVANADPFWSSLIDASKPAENYMRTLPDTDDYGDITWGEWSVALNETWDDGVNPADVWEATYSGFWIAGTMTPSSVIDTYRASSLLATYNGALVGRAIDTDWGGSVYAVTNFTGTAVSNVDFGADTVSTVLNYTIGADTYNIDMTNTIVGNTFSDNASSVTVLVNGSALPTSIADTNGAFYGAEGKTLGGSFSIDVDNHPAVNNIRSMSGVYEGSTMDLP